MDGYISPAPETVIKAPTRVPTKKLRNTKNLSLDLNALQSFDQNNVFLRLNRHNSDGDTPLTSSALKDKQQTLHRSTSTPIRLDAPTLDNYNSYYDRPCCGDSGYECLSVNQSQGDCVSQKSSSSTILAMPEDQETTPRIPDLYDNNSSDDLSGSESSGSYNDNTRNIRKPDEEILTQSTSIESTRIEKPPRPTHFNPFRTTVSHRSLFTVPPPSAPLKRRITLSLANLTIDSPTNAFHEDTTISSASSYNSSRFTFSNSSGNVTASSEVSGSDSFRNFDHNDGLNVMSGMVTDRLENAIDGPSMVSSPMDSVPESATRSHFFFGVPFQKTRSRIQTISHPSYSAIADPTDLGLIGSRETYKDGPICILPPNLYLFEEPSKEQIEKFDVVINVAEEVRNPLEGGSESVISRKSLDNCEVDQASASANSSVESNTTIATGENPTPCSSLESISRSDDSFDTIGKASNESSGKPEYVFVPWGHNSELLSDLPHLTELMENKLAEGKKVLVHCQCGVSRSVSLIIAFVMKVKNLDLNAAYALVKEKVPQANPNMSLVFQLMDWGSMLKK